MKIIGICGNYGKTTTCEMIYQYLILKNYKVGLLCSNGFFVNNETKEKNTFNAIIDKSRIDQLPEDLDYIVAELNEECVYYNEEEKDPFLNNHFDILLNVSYSPRLYEKHKDDHPDYLFKVITDIEADEKVCFNDDKEVLEKQTSLKLKTFQLPRLVNYSLTKTTFVYNNSKYTSKFSLDFELQDAAAMLYVVEYFKEFDKDVFKKFLDTCLVRGHIEIHKIKNKTIILDTGWFGLKETLVKLTETCKIVDKDNLSVILYCFPEDTVNPKPIVYQWREEAGKFINDNTIPLIISEVPDYRIPVFENMYKVNSYVYIYNSFDAIDHALLLDKDVIYIMGNYKFRKFREDLLNLEEKEINENV